MKSKDILLFLILLVSATGCNFSLAADVTPPPGYQSPVPQQTTPVASAVYPPLPPDPASGAAIYAEKCAPCHGVTGLGDGESASQLPNPVPALGAPEEARQANPRDWYNAVTNGNLESFMPPFNSLSERQRWDVVAYALTMSTNPDNLAQSAVIYQAECAECHGETGKGDGPQAATLGDSVPDFADLAFLASRSNQDLFNAISAGIGTSMPAYDQQLNDAERWGLTEYVRSLALSNASGEQAALPTQAESQAATGQPTETVVANTTTTDGRGTIQGQIINASGGAVPADLEVALHAFEEMTLVYSDTAKTRSDGTYQFDDIDMSEGRIFFTTTEFQDMIYGSDRGESVAGDTVIDLPIEVYESTTDPSDVLIDRVHIFPEYAGENLLRITELILASNTGKKTLIPPGPDQGVLEFDLPDGATNLQFSEDVNPQRFASTGSGFVDLMPFVPGTRTYELMYSYDLPYDGKYEYKQEMTLPVKAVLVAIPEDGIKIKSTLLEDAGTVEGQGGNFHVYNGREIVPGASLEMTISGKPSGGSTVSEGSQTGIIIGIAAFGLALVVAGLWLYSKMKSQVISEKLQHTEEPNGISSESAEDLMDAILALDDLYKEGKLTEEAYLDRRNELKTRLKELLDREQGQSG